jgi:hypothetical protein
MIDAEFARRFADEWIAAWNAHDLERILARYEDDFVMTSPVIVAIAGEPSGRLRGKAAVGAYWFAALQRMPDLHFELCTVFAGINGLTVHYQGPRGMVVEIFELAPTGKVAAACAHYANPVAVSRAPKISV